MKRQDVSFNCEPRKIVFCNEKWELKWYDNVRRLLQLTNKLLVAFCLCCLLHRRVLSSRTRIWCRFVRSCLGAWMIHIWADGDGLEQWVPKQVSYPIELKVVTWLRYATFEQHWNATPIIQCLWWRWLGLPWRDGSSPLLGCYGSISTIQRSWLGWQSDLQQTLCRSSVTPTWSPPNNKSIYGTKVCIHIIFCPILKEFLDWTLKPLTLHLQPLTTSKMCLCHHFYTTIYSHICGQSAKVFRCSYDRWGLAAFETRDFFKW